MSKRPRYVTKSERQKDSKPCLLSLKLGRRLCESAVMADSRQFDSTVDLRSEARRWWSEIVLPCLKRVERDESPWLFVDTGIAELLWWNADYSELLTSVKGFSYLESADLSTESYAPFYGHR